MTEDNIGRNPSGQALVNQAATHLDPSGFDPSRVSAACIVLDSILDEPINDEWDKHISRCVIAVLTAYGRGHD